MPRRQRERQQENHVSLSYEVACLRRAVDCARRTLTDAEYLESTEQQERRREAEAVLVLLSERMRQLSAVLRREADPATILAEHNISPTAEDDVVLTSRQQPLP